VTGSVVVVVVGFDLRVTPHFEIPVKVFQIDGRRRIPYIVIAPEDPSEIGRAAAETYRQHFGSALDLVRSPNVATLGRLVDAGRDPDHGELLSYLFFARAFAERLIDLGQRDVMRWLSDDGHDAGIWQVGR
jgi:NTE family protein